MASADKPRRSQSLELYLPLEVKIVESYVTWMEELAEHVEKSAFSKADSLDNYIKLILEDDKSQRNESGAGGDAGDNEDEDSDWSDNVGHVASKMNIAAMYTYLGDWNSAQTHLDTLQSEHLEKLNLTTKHKEVVEYFRDSLAWSIKVLKGLEQEKEGSKYGYLIQGSSKLNCKYEDLTEEGDEQIKATLAFLKACLSAAMKVSEDVTLDLLMQATKLDPQCYIWYHYAYRIMRRIRRNVKRSVGSKLPRPSREESRLAKTAYDLCPTDVVAITDYALLLKETLWMENKYIWQRQEDDYLKCVELFERALCLSNETGNKKWSRKIKVYLAEFLAFGKGEKLDQDRGKDMFDECAVEYPKSTFVLHKVGKLYHHGLARTTDHDGKCIDLERAKEYYKRAIDSNSGNYACLMDYLKLLQRLHEYSAMIEAVDTALENSKRDYQVAKLYILKAFIIWIYNPTDLPDHKSAAVQLWMYILKNYPAFAKDIYNNNDPIIFVREHPDRKVKAEVVEYLESVKNDFQDEGDGELIATFIEELSKSVNRETRPRWERNGDGGKPRGNRNGDNRGEDDLSQQMKGLSVSSRSNCQRPMEKQGVFKNRWEARRKNESGGENESKSRNNTTPTEDDISLKEQ